jgi:hypothetical protein
MALPPPPREPDGPALRAVGKSFRIQLIIAGVMQAFFVVVAVLFENKNHLTDPGTGWLIGGFLSTMPVGLALYAWSQYRTSLQIYREGVAYDARLANAVRFWRVEFTDGQGVAHYTLIPRQPNKSSEGLTALVSPTRPKLVAIILPDLTMVVGGIHRA